MVRRIMLQNHDDLIIILLKLFYLTKTRRQQLGPAVGERVEWTATPNAPGL